MRVSDILLVCGLTPIVIMVMIDVGSIIADKLKDDPIITSMLLISFLCVAIGCLIKFKNVYS